MDQDVQDRFCIKHIQGVPDGLRARRPARDKGDPAAEQLRAAHHVVGMEHDHDAVEAIEREAIERVDRARKHRAAVQRPPLLRLAFPGARAAPGGDDHRGCSGSGHAPSVSLRDRLSRDGGRGNDGRTRSRGGTLPKKRAFAKPTGFSCHLELPIAAITAT